MPEKYNKKKIFNCKIEITALCETLLRGLMSKLFVRLRITIVLFLQRVV